MKMQKAVISALIGLIFLSTVFGQEANNVDQTLRGTGRINPSTLAMEFDLPLGNYPGRGINVPVSVSYSSKVWRMQYSGIVPRNNTAEGCNSMYIPWFAEDSASGWTSSLAVPYIEYTGKDTIYNPQGFPIGEDTCNFNAPQPSYHHLVRRLVVHLPSGETHELYADAGTTVSYIPGQNPPASIWNATFYAADGSNIKYIEDSNTGTFKLLMPDGSVYNFSNSFSNLNNKSVRKATQFTDRNGNFTSFNDTNGTWTDTLGRTLSAPLGLNEPDSPTTQTYSMPGMTGTYKFVWKQLKGSSAAESGLTDFNQNLRYRGSTYASQSPYPWGTHPTGTFLFGGTGTELVTGGIFNPVVLTEIELPTGQKYKFRYSIYGLIEKIEYPTGGEEEFVYEKVPTLSLSIPSNINDKTNLGVINRKLLKTSGDTSPYQWTYSADYVDPMGYKITINNPDGTFVERFLHRGKNSVTCCPASSARFGFDNGLAGMSYEERVFDSSEKLVSKTLTHWTKNSFGYADWHPRVTHSETHTYNSTGNGDKVWGTVKYEYEDLSTFDKPLLRNKTSEYAYQSSGSSLAPEEPGEDPEPEPTPVPTPTPPTLVRTTEYTYLINDTTVTNRQNYKDRNMVGLVTATVVKDGAGTIVSRSEMKYDDSGYSPSDYVRGNPTTSRVWDSTKGLSTNSSAYIQTKARFDSWGNQYESIDAKGISTLTTFDSTHHAFPVQVTSAIPGNGTNGSNTAFVTTAEFDFMTGLPLKTTNANGVRTEIEYDPVTLRPKKVKTFYQNNQVGSEAETIYHDEPNNYWVKNRSQIDATNWAESITYFDGLGRAYKSEKIDSEGNIFVDKEFDSDGRVLRVSNPYRANETKYWTTNVYDESSRVIEVVLPDGAKVKTDYGVSITGVVGTTKQITDQAGKKRKGITDALGRMIRVIEDPSGQALNTDYVFDTLGNLRKTIQGEQSRYFSYDSLGRLLRAKQPEQDVNSNLAMTTADPVTGHNQWSVAYSYDDNGNILTTTDAKNTTVTATYDNFNRIIKRDYNDSTPDVDFYYDGKYLDASGNLQTAPGSALGKTTGIKSSVSKTNYTNFDELGRLKNHQQITDGTVYNTGYTYNLSGALIEETYPSGRKVKVTLNSDGEMKKLESKKSTVNDYKLYLDQITLNSAGSIEKMRLGNGKWESAQYNSRQQITQIGLGHSATDKSLLKIDYGYGDNTENNSSLRQQRINYAGLANEIVQNYTYDDLNRLKSATEVVSTNVWKQTFNYDRYGNRMFDAANTTTISQSSPAKVTNPTIQTSNNRLTEDQDGGGIDYDYDANGNLILDAENQRFVFDAENHIKEFFRGTNSGTIADATYKYDGDGKRVKKISDTVETIFVYNASGQLVAEYSTEISTAPKASYLTADHLGSPRIATDGIGTVISRHDYLAFGDELTETLGNVGGRTNAQGYGKPDEIRQGYTGYENDEESGLEYAQARYYNSAHGRFTSVDPLTASASIRDPQTFNRYSYVLNSPYKFTDPLGLLPEGVGINSGGGCSAEYSSCVNESRWEWASETAQDSNTNDADETPATEHTSSEGVSAGPSAESAPAPPPAPDYNAESTSSGGQKSFFQMLWDSHAGNKPFYTDPKTGKPPENYDHQCAINMSAALQSVGIDMSSFAKESIEVNVGGKTWKLALRVEDLYNWLLNNFASDPRVKENTSDFNPNWNRKKFGDKSTFTDTFRNFIEGKRGIVILLDSWKSDKGVIGDHMDLWDGRNLKRATARGEEDMLKAGRTFYFFRLQ